MAAVLRETEKRTGKSIDCVHIAIPLNCPGQEETSIAACEKLDMNLDVVEPEVDMWEWLAALPRKESLLQHETFEKFLGLFSAGTNLVAYQYEHNYDGAFSGMRADESRGRKMNTAVRGSLYQIAVDQLWMCNPICGWTARDVFACAVALDLPIHPHYQRLYERFGESPESPGSRVDVLFTTPSVRAMGTAVQARTLYPEIWERLVELRPEVRAGEGG